jgi:hypothetical protein
VLVAILCQLQDSGELAQLSISMQHIAALLKVLDMHAVSDAVQEVWHGVQERNKNKK